MWKNFQKALEKRVRNSKKKENEPDKFVIIKKTQEFILENYGKKGLENIEVTLSKKNNILVFICQKSVWKSEILLNREKMIEKINKKIGKNFIENCYVK